MEVLERTTWKSPELDAFGEVDDNGTLLVVEVVLVDVRERDATCWFGDGVSRSRGLVVTAAFQGAQSGAIFVFRKILGNLVTL